jgi:hypothetical protein
MVNAQLPSATDATPDAGDGALSIEKRSFFDEIVIK